MNDQPGSGAASLLGNPPAPPADPGASNPPPVTHPPAASPSWLDSIQDPETKTWAQGKGWKEVPDIVRSYQNLEKHLGGEKIPMPKDANDAEGWDRLFKAAGRPDDPDAYGLDKIEGADPEFVKAAQDVFHKAGLNPNQAKALTEWYGSQAAEVLKAETEGRAQKQSAELEEFKKEAGQAYPAKEAAARQAAQQFELDADALTDLETAMGSKKMMSFLAKIGEGLGEAKFHGNAGGAGGMLTPAAASEQKASLLKDPAFLARIHSKDPGAMSQLERLQKIEAGIS